MKPGGRLVAIDVVAPETPLFDTALQVVEFLRDSSHVRNYRVSEWSAMLPAAGFAAPEVDRWSLSMDFDTWITTIGTPPARVDALRTVFAAMPAEVREHYKIAAGHSFVIHAAWLDSRRS